MHTTSLPTRQTNVLSAKPRTSVQVSPDASAQAMTEVALGLSMAFFAILILALLSIGVPADKESLESRKTLSIENTAVLAENMASKEDVVAQHKDAPNILFLFYMSGKFYTQEFNQINPKDISYSSSVVLSVAPGLSLKQAISAQSILDQYNDITDLNVTYMDQAWEDAFAARNIK